MGKLGLFRNEEGDLSGSRLTLYLACLLTAGWLIRDLIMSYELNEWHTVLFGILLLTGLVNRISGRGTFRFKVGRDGAEIETREGHDR